MSGSSRWIIYTRTKRLCPKATCCFWSSGIRIPIFKWCKRTNNQFFKMPFLVTNKSLFTSGSHLRYFDLNRTTTLLSMANWDEVLYKAYAKEGTLELCDNCFRLLTHWHPTRNFTTTLLISVWNGESLKLVHIVYTFLLCHWKLNIYQVYVNCERSLFILNWLSNSITNSWK